MAREYEIKAVFDPEMLPALNAHPLLADALAGAAPMQTISTYYDTDGLHLWHAGISLRIRRTPVGLVQTLKQAGTSIVDRGEWEWPLETDQLDEGVLTESPLAACLPRVDDRLSPRVVVDVARTTFDLRAAATRIEGALDRGTISGSGRRLAVCEIELELKEGAPRDVVALARQLVGDLPLTPSVLSKAERGFSMGPAAADTPVKGLDLELTPGLPLDRTITAIVGACVRAIVINAGLIEGPARMEAVHQTRVAVRRLRTALSLFKPHIEPARHAHLDGELRWISGLLGAARDRDVHQAEVFDPAAAETPTLFGSRDLAAAMRGLQRADHAKLRDALASARWRLLLLDLVATPLAVGASDGQAGFEAFVRRRLKRRRARLLSLASSLRPLSPDARHAVRKKAKTLRYAFAFFDDVLPDAATKRYRRTQRALGTLQEALGHLHDKDALRDGLAKYAETSAGAADARSLFAAGVLAERPIETHRLLKSAENAYAEIRSVVPF